MNRRFGLRAFECFVLALCFTWAQTAAEGQGHPKLLLRVVNRHFTVGKRIPSAYLMVFSDGSVECHALKFGRQDKDDVKKMQLSAEELAKLTSALHESGLQELSRDYKLQRFVVDSWMEWDISIEQPHRKNVTVAFAGGSGQKVLPDALGKLGCLILELRHKAYGDDTTYYSPACAVK